MYEPTDTTDWGELPRPEQERRKEDRPSSTLDRYLAELARLPVMSAGEELDRARSIESLEVALWQRILAYAPLVPPILSAVERTLGRALEGSAPLLEVAAQRGELAGEARRVAEQVVRRDLDRAAIAAALEEVRGRAPLRVRRAVTAAHRRAQRVKHDFVRANLRLVVHVAKRYRYAMPLSDLVQEGNLGLLKAVDRFDYRRGHRFSTYAMWWIRHAIQRAVADKSRTIRLPVHLLDARRALRRAEGALALELGRQPTREELRSATGMTSERIDRIAATVVDRPLSLDRPLGDDQEDRRLHDVLPDPAAEDRTAADQLADRALADELRAQIAQLKPMEADVVRRRFGVGSGEELTLKELGERYGLSRERIRQIQEQAITKLRRGLRRRGLA